MIRPLAWVTAVFVGCVFAEPLRAQAPVQADLFFIPETSSTTNREDSTEVKQSVYDDIRNGMNEADRQRISKERVDAYEEFRAHKLDGHFELALEQLRNYMEALRQLSAPSEKSFQNNMADALYQSGICYEKLGNPVQAVRHWQRVLWQYKESRSAPKAALSWIRLNKALLAGAIEPNANLPAPDPDLFLRRCEYALGLQEKADEFAEILFLKAETEVRAKKYDAARLSLRLLREGYPQSDAVDNADELEKKIPD